MKRINCCFLLFVLFFFLEKFSYSQKITKYNYVINEHIMDTNKPYFGMEYEFSTYRKYVKRNTFYESRLFTGSAAQNILYKIVDSVWYFKFNNKWNLFYNYSSKQGGDIYIGKQLYEIKYIKRLIIRNLSLDELILNPIGITQSHSIIYFFNFVDGVVFMELPSGAILVRKDCLHVPLTEDEINEF